MTITPEELERWKEWAEAAHGVQNPRHEADVCPRVLRLIARVQELESYVEGDALCPRCESLFKCDASCTFLEDDPDHAEKMHFARSVLRHD